MLIICNANLKEIGLLTPNNTFLNYSSNKSYYLDKYDGGDRLESVLFGNKIIYLTIESSLFILNEDNWNNIAIDNFRDKFIDKNKLQEIKKKKKLKKKKKKIQKSKKKGAKKEEEKEKEEEEEEKEKEEKKLKEKETDKLKEEEKEKEINFSEESKIVKLIKKYIDIGQATEKIIVERKNSFIVFKKASNIKGFEDDMIYTSDEEQECYGTFSLTSNAFLPKKVSISKIIKEFGILSKEN